ncbi:MAG: CsbD family protein [Actinobacteria bacterium]|nr:MAG: CsbD family protein [Actinomycetota bacterium]REK40820.1 MAG: CsbD family protein [Actinomycetota bacterium]
MQETNTATLQQEGNWEQFKGKAREEWGELTDQELEQARGNWEQFVGTVKEKTGETKENIEQKFEQWTS